MSAGGPVEPVSALGRAWEIASDLVIVTAMIWTIPLLVGVVVALCTFLFR